uniref:Uncharacterized protein n=1 Tax=Arundo donax TaxID=35708 RepID=A0A0A9G9Q7_ARUDO
MIDRWNRGRSMGRELDRLNRSICSKLPVHVAEGKKRPDVPIQAAKLASEGGIILRQHIPILPHWKEYKKDQSHLKDYMGKVKVHVTLNTNSKSVTDACADLLKSRQQQMRYRLKKTHFDGIPANQVRATSPLSSMTDNQWRALVDMWSDSKHKDKCVKNKANREKVQFQQKTGSRCYIAHCHALRQDKYKDEQPTAFDLFKDCHCSSNTGFTEPVKKAIADMEAIMTEPIEDGQQPKSATEAISQVLPSAKFLQNISLESAAPKKSCKAAVDARVQELEGALEIEKQGATNLREQLDGQQQELDNLKKQVQDSEAKNAKHQEEIDILKTSEEAKKASEETNTFLRRLLCPEKV